MRASLFMGALSLIVLALVASVNGASRPTASVPNCDASSPDWGCPFADFRRFRNGRIDRLTCRTRPEPRMSWAIKVKRSGMYTTWAGKEDKKLTEYIPDTVMDISIRVNNYTHGKYRGILIYAQADNGKRVGEWLLPREENPFFQLPWPNNHECRQSLTHNSAELKPLKSTWKFKAPAKGTGRITFHCLIKEGDANTGAFYWPNGGRGPLRLRESTKRKQRQTWFRSNFGQSCDARCAQEKLKCDRVHLERINSPQRIEDIILPQGFPCKLPYVSGCSNRGPAMGADGICYYDDTRCKAQGRNAAPVTCASSTGRRADGQRMCKCVTTTLPPANPGRTVIAARGTTTSPATKATTSFFFMALALLGLTMKSSSKMTTSVALALFLVALVAMPSVHAHNWQFSEGRSKDVASTQTPCPARIQAGPHVQVGPNQYFEIEWAVGHTQPSYYVIVKADDEPRLRTVSFASMETYLREAPMGACRSLPVYHRRFRARDASFNPHSQYYSGEILPNSPNFIPRPEAFGPWRDDAKLFGYKNNLELNNYCEYSNTRMSFIEGIFKFEHWAHRPQDADMVRLKIPGRGGFGAYVVQWLWRGYRDCIDVDYVNRQVKDIYGLTNPDGGFTRVDHCFFPNYRDVFECHRIFTDATICARSCQNRRGGCQGYVVMPRQQVPNRYNGQANLLPQLCKDNVVSLGENPRNVDVCFTVRARLSSETFGPTEVVHAGDPAYHSTCYLKGSGRLFPNFDIPPQHQDIPWRHGDRCISCDAVNLNKNASRIPKWPMTDDCRNCDIEPKRNTPRFNPPKLILRAAKKFCDGHNTFFQYMKDESNKRWHKCTNQATADRCHKEVLIRGRAAPWNTRHFANDCAVAAAKDPECSDNVYTVDQNFLMYRGKPGVRCYCTRKIACCRGCRPRAPTNNPQLWNVYTLDRGFLA